MSDKIIPIKPTDDEQGWLAIMRLNKLWSNKQIRKEVKIGRITVAFEWRSRDNFMGRFGGGWNWHVGAQWSSQTILVYCLIFMLRFYYERPKP